MGTLARNGLILNSRCSYRDILKLIGQIIKLFMSFDLTSMSIKDFVILRRRI